MVCRKTKRLNSFKEDQKVKGRDNLSPTECEARSREHWPVVVVVETGGTRSVQGRTYKIAQQFVALRDKQENLNKTQV